MSKTDKSSREAALDPGSLEILGSAAANADFSVRQLARLRERVMQRLGNEQNSRASFLTIRSNEGS